ncbi:MAG: AIPR family protein [Elusimicrobiales bacterium]|nr:AIPR family protein [Elusimicrobiales bacterium]
MNIEEFCRTFGYECVDMNTSYKLLANYSILASYSHDTISNDIQDAMSNIVINGVTFDGFVILLDNRIITSVEAISDIYASNESVRSEIVIVESVLKSKDSNKLSEFLSRIEEAFSVVLGDVDSNNTEIPENDILTFLYQQCVKNSCPPPILNIYFVADDFDDSEKSKESPEFSSIFSSDSAKDSFSAIKGFKLNTSDLLRLYNHSKIKDSAEITPYSNYIALPAMPGVKDALIAVVSFKEFKKLLIDSNGGIKTSIFHDNIRAYQGVSVVSKQMTATLNQGNFDQFIAMNNGITIIVGELNRKSGYNLELLDYQIVNGCQTCHVLYNQRNLNGIDKLLLLVKIVCSTNEGVRNSIIMGTNSQIEVKREQLIALTGLQERIEDYYSKMQMRNDGSGEPLYYERRSKQYVTETKVPQNKVITIPIEIMSFGAIFLSSPHYVAGYYSQIIENLKNKGKEIFSEKYMVDPYYTSGLMFYKLSHLFNTRFIDSKYKKIKYQLLYAARLVAELDYKEMPGLESKEIEEYCLHLNRLFCDDKRCKSCFKKAVDILDRFIPANISDSLAQKREITESVQSYVQELKESLHSENKDEIVTKRFNEFKDCLTSKTSSYYESKGLTMAIKTLTAFVKESSSEICIISGNILSRQNNDESFIRNITTFLEKKGRVVVLIYGNKENLLNSQLLARLALCKSNDSDVSVKILKKTPLIESEGQKRRYNMYLFDTESVRIELEHSFSIGHMWLHDREIVEKYKKSFSRLSETSDDIDIVGLFKF